LVRQVSGAGDGLGAVGAGQRLLGGRGPQRLLVALQTDQGPLHIRA